MKLNGPGAGIAGLRRRNRRGVFWRRLPLAGVFRPAGHGVRGGSAAHVTGPEDRAIDQSETAVSRFAAAELQAGERVAGRYRIEALLGVGGMGVVYRAHDEQLGIDIALKLLRPELAARPEAFDRFRRELLLARQVSSPHVVRIHDLVGDGERWLISMDYVPGRSLEQHLDERGALAVDEALAIARQIALGLGAAHASGIVHRDLKPANVLLRDDGHACISDFGVARSVGATRMTAAGAMVGTPDYVSPEQARGDEVGPRSDLYALGLILYEMLAGRRAFDDATPAESLARRQSRAPAPLRETRDGIAPWIDRLLQRLLDPNPLRRLRGADAVVAAIDTQRVAPARPTRRRVAMVAGAAALALAVGGGAWWQRQQAATKSPRAATTAAANAGLAATVAPLDLAVLPLQATETEADLARAYTALIGAGLLAADVPTADRRRVTHALSRLGYDAARAEQHAQRVLVEIGARRLLSGRLTRDGERLQVTLSLRGAGAGTPVRSVSTPAVSAAALGPAVRTALAGLGLGDAQAGLGTVWPTSEPALRAFGRGLGAGDGQAALDAYGEAIARDPRFVAAWWQRLQVARRALPASELATMTAAAREALRDVRGRDAERVQALLALVDGNAALAVERFAPLVAADPHDHHTRLLLAEAREAAGDRAAAIAELDALTTSDPQNADAWLLRGQVALRAGEAQRAVDDHLVRARVLYTRLRDERGRADTLNALGLGFDMLGQSEPAVDYFTQAVQLRERIGDARGAVSSRRNLAWAHAVAGDAAAADADLAGARALATKLQDPVLLADVAVDAGLIAEERGDFRAALPHFREAMRLREARGDAAGVAEAAHNLAFALLQTGDFGDARAFLQQAERTYVAAGERVGIVHSLQLLAAVDLASGDYAAARERLTRALRMAEEVNLAEERAVLHAEMAELERLQGRLDAAQAQARSALALFEQQGDARGATESRLRLVAVHRDRNDWEAAAKELAGIDADALANREQSAMLHVRRGEVALGRRDAQAALRSAGDALVDARASNSLPALAHAHLLRTQALATLGDAVNARAEAARLDRVLADYPAASLRRERDRVAAGLLASAPARRPVAGRNGDDGDDGGGDDGRSEGGGNGDDGGGTR